MSDNFLIVDGNNLFYRAFYALPRLTAPDGTPTGAVFGFLKMMNKVLERFRPGRVVVVFDAPGKTFREEMFEAYKETRQKMPEDMSVQLPLVKEVLGLKGISVLEIEGVEADDVIGTLAKEGRNAGHEVIIVSSDKDLCQLVEEGVVLFDSLKDVTIDREYVVKKYGVPPEKIVDLIALAGDASDNIPGVPGIGDKTAASLISEFGSVDGLLSNLDFVKGRKKEAIKENLESLRMSRELAAVKRDVSLPVKVGELIPGEEDTEALREVFKKLGFGLPLLGVSQGEGRKEKKVKICAFDRISSEEELKNFLCRPGGEAVSVVVTGDGFVLSRGAGRTVVCGRSLAPYVPGCFSDAGRVAVFYDAKASVKNLPELEGLVGGDFEDVMLMVYLLYPEESSLQFERMCRRILGEEAEADSLPQMEKAARDAELLYSLFEACGKFLEVEGLTDLYLTMERPLLQILLAMEKRGIGLREEVLARLSTEIEEELREIEEEIAGFGGGEVNLASPKQVSLLLFEKLKLPVLKKTKTGYSTDMGVLEELSALHEVPGLIIKHRMLSKLKSTYVDVLPRMVDPRTGKIHTSFHQTTTATGRLSSSNPNLQNIPIRMEIGKRIRNAFIPEAGYLFLSADYSQIELRVLAHLSGDEGLCEIFHSRRDVHAETALALFGVEGGRVTPEMRRKAKVVNFGIIYGMTPYGLSKELKIGQGEAKEYIDGYFSRYPGVKRFIEETVEKARRDGFVETLFGRKRKIPDVLSRNQTLRNAAERMAINTPVQGTAADIIKMSMIRLYRSLSEGGFDAHLVLQIHDELILEVREEILDEVRPVLREAMERVVDLAVPLVVDLTWGKSWGEL